MLFYSSNSVFRFESIKGTPVLEERFFGFRFKQSPIKAQTLAISQTLAIKFD